MVKPELTKNDAWLACRRDIEPDCIGCGEPEQRAQHSENHPHHADIVTKLLTRINRKRMGCDGLVGNLNVPNGFNGNLMIDLNA